MAEEERTKLLSPTPVLIRKIRERPLLIERPFRSAVLDYTEDLSTRIRTREFWTGTGVRIIQELIARRVIGAVRGESNERRNR